MQPQIGRAESAVDAICASRVPLPHPRFTIMPPECSSVVPSERMIGGIHRQLNRRAASKKGLRSPHYHYPR